MTLAYGETISIEEAKKRGLEGILETVAHGHSVVIQCAHDEAAAVVALDEYRAHQEISADIHDAVLAIARMAGDSGHRTSLDDVIAKLGFTREELEALDD